MIPLPEEYLQIEEMLRDRTMSGQQASDAIHATRGKLGPPWQWRAWKSTRDGILGACCEKCGKGHEAILVLQHTIKLPKLGDCVEHVKFASDYYDTLQAEKRAIEDAETPQPRACCPKCESTAIVYRKRAGNWICNGKTNKKSCKHTFDAPAETLALTPQQKRDVSDRKAQAWSQLSDQRRDIWLREGILLWLQKMRRYLSLEDTKTLCKRCAFMEDMTTQEPCSVCGFGVEIYEKACRRCGTGRHEAPRPPA